MSGKVPPPADPGAPSTATGEALFDIGLNPPDDLQTDEGSSGNEDQPFDRIGVYELRELLGEGGFGVVWSVHQTEPIQRDAALKILKRGMDSRKIIARFSAERRALAMMDHPNIAAIFDAGTARCGRPYFAMELVRGMPLTTYCDERRLTIRQRLELFIPVCQAVQHAHQKGILHRDLKPSNILVAEIDGRPVPKVIDFGIAKALGADEGLGQDVSQLRTMDGALLGTLPYMSPEQAGSMPDLDTRSDIYSLGAILYELLTGHTPLDLAAEALPYDEALRRVRSGEVRPPSRSMFPHAEFDRIVSECRGTDPVKLRRTLRADLDWIARKALEKDRQRRYETVNALASDLGRYLRSEPVTAAAPTWGYHASKFAGRYRTVLVTGALILGTSIVGTVVSLNQAAAAKAASAQAEQSRQEAVASHQRAEANFLKARDAVNLYLNEVTEDSQLKDERFSPLRKRLLETAVPFFEALTDDHLDSPDFRLEKAKTFGRLGNIYRLSGEPGKACEAFAKGLALVEDLVASFPKNEDYIKFLLWECSAYGMALADSGLDTKRAEIMRRALQALDDFERDSQPDASSHILRSAYLMFLAQAQCKSGQAHEGIESGRKALSLVEPLLAQAPDNLTYLRMTGNCYNGLGDLFRDQHLDDEAVAHLTKAAGLRRRLAELQPGEKFASSDLNDTLQRLANTLARQNRRNEAADFLHERVLLSQTFRSRFSSDKRSDLNVGIALQDRGENLEALGRTSEAEADYLDAERCFRPFFSGPGASSAEFPWAVFNARRVAAIHLTKGDPSLALTTYEQAIGYARRAVNEFPGDMARVQDLRMILLSGSSFYLQMGKPSEALALAMDIPFSAGGGWSADEAVAAGIMRAVAGVEAADDPSPDRDSRIGKAASLALDFLKRAVDSGDPNLEQIKQDPLFEPLRARASLETLMEGPPDPAGYSPVSFKLPYAGQDPGDRLWSKEGGEAWLEKQPSGLTHRFQTVGRRKLGGVSGTELQKQDGSNLRLFLPDLETPEPRALLMLMDGRWRELGKITEVK